MPADFRMSVNRTGTGAFFCFGACGVSAITRAPAMSSAPAATTAAYLPLARHNLDVSVFVGIPGWLIGWNGINRPDSSTPAAGPTTGSFPCLERSVDDGYREFEQLLPSFAGHGLVDDHRHRRRSLQNLLDAMNIQPPSGVATFEALQHFSGFVDSSGFVIEHAQRAIAAGPLRQQIDRLLELLARLRGLAFQNGEQAVSPEKFARTWVTGEAFL